MTLLLLYLALALGVSFFCSIMESVILSVTPVYIQTLSEHNPKISAQLKDLKDNIDRPLAAILSLNTVAHTVGAAGVGAQAVAIFGEAYFGLISVILTILILVLSEIIPKTLGASYWQSLAPTSVSLVKGMIIFTWPLIWIAEKITKVMAVNKHLPSTSREDILALAKIGFKQGTVEKKESVIIRNLILSRKIRAEDVMTPRTVVHAAPESMTLDEFIDQQNFMRFSRIPLYENNIDQITGFVLKSDALEKLARDNHGMALRDIRRDAVMVFKKTSVPSLFDLLMSRKEHMAIVMDEYGGMSGIVTLEDIIETLLGLEIQDELDNIEDMQELARRKWRKRSELLKKHDTRKGAKE